MSNVAALLDEAVAKYGDAPALVDCGQPEAPRTIGFRGLREAVLDRAAALSAAGVRPGDRVVIFVPMSVELYAVLLGCMYVGATAVFVDPWAGRRFIGQAAEAVRPRAFVGVPRAHLLRLGVRALREAPLAFHLGGGAAARAVARACGSRRLCGARAELPVGPAPRAAHDTALITFTSGTTGPPRGAERSHGMLLAQDARLAEHVTQAPGDVHLTNLPIVVLHNLSRGVASAIPATAVAQDPTTGADELSRVLDAANVSVVTLSPPLLRTLVAGALDGTVPTAVCARVRQLHTGGGPVLPSLCEDAAMAFPQARLTILYGSTEAEPIAALSGGELRGHAAEVARGAGLPVGVPDAATRTLIVPVSHGSIELGDGEQLHARACSYDVAGEVVVAGEHVVRSYIGNDEAVRSAKIRDADGTVWHRTGDVARIDEDGVLWLLGRVGSAVTVADTTLWPFAVEAPVVDDPAVSQAALVAVDEAAVLAVEPAAGASAAECRQHAASVLAAADLADAVTVAVVDAIPVDPRHGAKVDRAALVRTLRPMHPLS